MSVLQDSENCLSKLQSSEVIFIQIGANDGVMSNDYLHSFIQKEQWKGILIEPVPWIFERLKKNYAHIPHLHFENVAISDSRRVADFYVVDPESEYLKEHPELVNQAGGPWGDQKGSLDRSQVERAASHYSEVKIVSLPVQCVTLQDIVEKYQLRRIDLLQIDTEGHDDVILLSIDYTNLAPQMIIFEHSHLSFDRYLHCIAHLQLYGYEVVYTGVLDTIVSRNAAAS